jgi:hypothetical protein
MTITPAADGWVEVEGGYARGVIDLASPAEPERGGMDPEAGLVLTEMPVTGRVMTGHTADLDDPAAPILIRETDISGPPASGALYVEGKCPSCITKSAIFRSDGETLLVLQHEPGCPAFRRLLAQVPR